MDAVTQFSNSFWFNNPAISSAYVGWAKTQPGYENWDGKPIPLTLEEDRKLTRDLYAWTPDPSAYNFKYAGVTPEQFLVPVNTQIEQSKALLKYIDDNPSMNTAQLTPGMDAIKAYYRPILAAQNQSVSNAVNAGLDKDLNPGGFWSVLDAGVQMMAGAALSVGGGAMLGGVLGGLGMSATASEIAANAAISGIKAAASGGDVGTAVLSGGLTGAVTSSGVLNNVSSGIIDATGATGNAASAITSGVNAAASSGISTAVNGGSFADALQNAAISGVVSGAGNYVTNTALTELNGVPPEQRPAPVANATLNDPSGNPITGGTYNDTSLNLTNALAGAAGGAVAGGTSAALNGGNIASGIITGAAQGGVGGLASDLGASPAVASGAGAVAGGLVNSAVQPDPIVSGPPAVQTTLPPAANPGEYGLDWGDGFSSFLYTNRRPEWGTRLNNGRAE